MKCSVLINNFNYDGYVCDAVNSILKQTVIPDEIIIVDDGSTDNSVKLLHDNFAEVSCIKIITTVNNGQLAAFNEGYLRSTGDIVFFLDSDDLYDEKYIESALSFYKTHPKCDFLISGRKEFGAVNQTVLDYAQDVDLGYSVISALHSGRWIGGPTSTLSMKRWVLDAFMPLHLESSWRVRADDCLVYGTSLVGAKKYYLAKPLVSYRVHNANNCFGKQFDDDYLFKYEFSKKQLINHISCKVFIDKDNILDLVSNEFGSTDLNRSIDKLKSYIRIIFISKSRFRWKISKIKRLISIYFKGHAPRF